MSTEPEIRFLSVENVFAIHDSTIREEGGSHGIRDLGLLQSAVTMPQATMFGAYLHEGLAGMASAYLFHLCQNHPFIDGNKRTAAFTTLLFLSLNGVADDDLPNEADMERVTLAIASGEMGKEEVTTWFSERTADSSE